MTMAGHCMGLLHSSHLRQFSKTTNIVALSPSWIFLSLVQRELRDRFAGAAWGLAWVLVQPLLMLGLYAFVFSFVFKFRLPGSDSHLAYVPFVAVALWPWFMFQESLSRAMGALRAQATLVRKTSLARDLPVLVSVIATLIVHAIGYLAVLIVLALMGAGWSVSGVLLFLITCCTIALGTLVVGLLASLAQLVWRDLDQALQPLLLILFYLTPILYPLTLVPEDLRGWVGANPLAWLAGRLRDGLQGGQLPGIQDIAVLLLCAMLLWLVRRVYLRIARQAEDLI
jgi:lipopolysaccharide transport system permease protein